jgi:hypothetical protein
MAIDEMMDSDAIHTASARTLWQLDTLRRRFGNFRALHYHQIGDAAEREFFDLAMVRATEHEICDKAIFQCSLVARLCLCTSLSEQQAYDFVYFYSTSRDEVLAVGLCHMLAYLGETDPALLLPGGFSCHTIVLVGVLRDLSEACAADHTLSRAYVRMIPACEHEKLEELTLIMGNQIVLYGPDRETAIRGTSADTHMFLVHLHRQVLRSDMLHRRHAGVALSYAPAKMLQAAFQEHSMVWSFMECVLCRLLELYSVHAVVTANFAEMGLEAADLLQFPRDFLTHILMLAGPFSAQNETIMAEAFPPPPSVLLGG